jgi:hypothetical protein
MPEGSRGSGLYGPGFFAGWAAALLLYPFTLLFPIFLGAQDGYAIARGDGGVPGPAVYRDAARRLEGATTYACPDTREPAQDERASALQVAERMSGAASAFPKKNLDAFLWARSAELPFFRQAFALYDVDVGNAVRVDALLNLAYRHCEEQRARVAAGGSAEPFDLYPRARTLLLESAERLERALDDYDAARMPFAFAMWAWALFEVVGLWLFAGQVRRAIRYFQNR